VSSLHIIRVSGQPDRNRKIKFVKCSLTFDKIGNCRRLHNNSWKMSLDDIRDNLKLFAEEWHELRKHIFQIQ
jgi:hypothetical protein